jgi:hypothetical protein
MHEPDFSQRDGEPPSPVRTFFGIVLIVLGVCVAGWLVVCIINLLAGGSMPPLVAAIAPDPGKPVKLDVPGGEVTLPQEVFKPIGYLLVCFVYAIVAGVAATLINGGTSLLQPDLGKVLRRMLDRLDRKRSHSEGDER